MAAILERNLWLLSNSISSNEWNNDKEMQKHTDDKNVSNRILILVVNTENSWSVPQERIDLDTDIFAYQNTTQPLKQCFILVEVGGDIFILSPVFF